MPKQPSPPQRIRANAMMLLAKGWWHYVQRPVTLEALERYDRMSSAGQLRSRPWWRGYSGRWRRL